VSVAAVLAATVSGGSVTSVDINSPGDLCEALSAEELNSLSPIEFGEGAALRWQGCSFAAPTDEGRDGVYLNLRFGESIDDVAARYDDEVEVEAAGRLGVAHDSKRDGYFFYVPADEHVLQVNVKLTEAAQAEGVDPRQLAADVASIAAPNLEAALVELEAAEAVEAEQAANSVAEPPEIEGVEWSVSRFDGIDIEADGNESQWVGLADAAGVSIDQLSILFGTALDTQTRDQVGSYMAIRVAGVDEATLVAAVIEWIGQQSGQEPATEGATVGGKEVTALSAGPEQQAIVYGNGDTAALIALSDEQTAALLEQLP
jgi:hypothetical protein